MMAPYLFKWSSGATPVILSEMSQHRVHFDAAAKMTVTSGLHTHNLFFKGAIFEQDKALRLLELTPSCFEELLWAAIERWGKKLNQYLIGDYVLVWQAEETVSMSSSARTSHSMYWRQDEGLVISSKLSQLINDKLKLNETQLHRQLSIGPMLSEETIFDNVLQLIPGETLVWCLKTNGKNIYRKIIDLSEQNKITESIDVSKETPSELNEKFKICNNQIFSSMPQLAYQLSEPLIDASLIEFSSYLKGLSAEKKSQGVVLSERWLKGRYQINDKLFNALNPSKKLFSKRLKCQCRQLKKLFGKLRKCFNNEEVNNKGELDFYQWFELNYTIPAWCQCLQRVASLHGVILINEFQNYQKAKSFLIAENKVEQKSTFNLDDPSVYNVFDAMQRLFYNGENATSALFRLAPINTSRLLKQSDCMPRIIEQNCIQLLTLDYLTKFLPCEIE